MATPIEDDAVAILAYLIKRQDEARSAGDVDQISEDAIGTDILAGTDLPAPRINDAVALLRGNGFVDGYDFLGTTPFNFGEVHVTPFGRYEYQRALAAAAAPETKDASTRSLPGARLDRLPVPIGSPYGFTEEDWEQLSLKRAKINSLNVVLGYQFKSEHYDSSALVDNLRGHFTAAVDAYNQQSGDEALDLVFTPLSAGYGEHLFNDIARAIIASDVAIFETSDLNPNVMIEMGVALTWGTRVLPVKQRDCPKPPSDISGQTWADYIESASEFADPVFAMRLLALVERAHRRKTTNTRA
jgi:hypothetical protein